MLLKRIIVRLIGFCAFLAQVSWAAETGLPECDDSAALGTSHELFMAVVGEIPFSIGTFHFDQVKEISMNGVIRRCEYPLRAFTGELGKITFIIRASSNEQGYTVQLSPGDL